MKFRSRLAKSWREIDLGELETLRRELESKESALVIEALICHLKGDLRRAADIYDSVDPARLEDRTLVVFRDLERAYLAMKLKRSSQVLSTRQRLYVFLRLFQLGRGALEDQIRHYYLYTWFISAFWYNQRQSLWSGLILFMYGAVSCNREATNHGRFLIGHVLNVMGYANLGIPLVTAALQRERFIQPWLRTCFFSYMTYGLFMVGQKEELAPLILSNADDALKHNPDPFYRILYWVSALRAASQSGDVIKCEAIAPLLIEISMRSGSKRFLYSSQADLALCYGIRGLIPQCEQLLRELANFTPEGADPVEVGSLLRLRGWANFFAGRYQEALRDSRESLFYFKKTKSFFMAREMARVLESVTTFRVKMETLTGHDLVHAAVAHGRVLRKLRSRYRKNLVLLNMINEEEAVFLGNFRRFSQPGYSRSANVVNCQRSLQSCWKEIIEAKDNAAAWHVIGSTIETDLGFELIEVKSIVGSPPYQARQSGASIEVTVSRTSSDKSCETFDVAAFRCEDRSQGLVMLDAIFSLQPTLLSLMKMRDLQGHLLANAAMVATADLAHQVAHDIRSPVSALNMVIASMGNEEAEKLSLIRSATKRINDIANSLLNRGKLASQHDQTGLNDSLQEPQRVSALLDVIISEKREQFKSFAQVEFELNINDDAIASFARLSESDFNRVISNLVNNAVESLPAEHGRVTVHLTKNHGTVIVAIKDNGCGIPKDVLPRLTERGFSFNKPNGSGLGLSYARACVEQWGGNIEIQSAQNEGTKIMLVIPVAEPPAWFAESLNLGSFQDVIALDDDPSLLNLWQHRFAGTQVCLHTFASSKELTKHLLTADRTRLLRSRFLIDYDLAFNEPNGVELIRKLGLVDQAILVTSRASDCSVRKQAEDIGLKILPKSLIPITPLMRDC